MRSEWKEVPLGDVIEFVVDNRGKTPPICENSVYELIEVNAISATLKSPQYGEIRKYVNKSTYENWFRKGHPKVGDVLVPTVGTLGAVSYMQENRGSIAQNLIALRADTKYCHGEFLYYVLRNPKTRQRLLNLDIGGVQPSIKVPHLLDLQIALPDTTEQRAIAATLSCLDDKIELNNKINANLEAQAQAIFKSWFVDFEPWDGVMPDEWREGCLADACGYCSDRVPVSALSLNTYISTENMLPNKMGFVNATSLPTTSQTTSFKDGDILISNIRPYFKKIVYCDFDGGCSTDVLCFRASKSSASLFLYCALYSNRFFDYMVAGSKGTKMPRGDKQQVMNYVLVIPNDEALSEFSSVISPLMKYIRLLNAESSRLAAIRDALLPKLMSGEIDVPLAK